MFGFLAAPQTGVQPLDSESRELILLSIGHNATEEVGDWASDLVDVGLQHETSGLQRCTSALEMLALVIFGARRKGSRIGGCTYRTYFICVALGLAIAEPARFVRKVHRCIDRIPLYC